jgi:hypothetical protein
MVVTYILFQKNWAKKHVTIMKMHHSRLNYWHEQEQMISQELHKGESGNSKQQDQKRYAQYFPKCAFENILNFKIMYTCMHTQKITN